MNILIVDDHPIVRDGLRTVLETEADFVVVGEASSGAEALRLVRELSPDVLLLDLEMPNGDGVETLRRLREVGLVLPTLIFTAFDEDERIIDAVRAGANGYLLKGAPRDELFNAVRVIGSGGSLLQPAVAVRLMQRVADPDPLTPREREVLALLAAGHANRAIAKRLVVTERTVKFHVSSILAKLSVTNRTAAVAAARQRGLLG